MGRNWIRIIRAILDIIEIIIDEIGTLLDRIFQRRRQLLFAAGFLYALIVGVFSLFKFDPEFVFSLFEGKLLPILSETISS